MQKIILSVVIPLYNAELYITECIASVQRQSLKEMEMICIDDGSEDETMKKLQKMQKGDKRICILSQKHGGAGRARNYGISVAKGDYISFLDGDDFYHDENALETMVNACLTNQVSICGSFRKILKNNYMENSPLFHEMQIETSQGMLLHYKEFQEDYYYQSFIFERNFLITNNIVFPEYLRYQDPPFFLKAMVLSQNFWVMPVTLYCYRFGHQSKRANAKKIKHTLMGVRDNLKVAIDADYYRLYEKLIKRINDIYYEDILLNLSDEVMEVLLDINSINTQYEHAKEITLLQNIYGYQEKRVEKFMDLQDSHRLLERIVKIQQSEYSFKEYYREKKINKAVVYGLGVYGEILINTLKESGVAIVGYIDKKVKEYEGYQVMKPDDNIPLNDILIVSPMHADEIVEFYKEKRIDRVVTFRKIIDEIITTLDSQKFLSNGRKVKRIEDH